MEITRLGNSLDLSRIVHGHWRLVDWNLGPKDLDKLIGQVLDLGITTFDHADIYGDYSCEKIFGSVVKRNPDIRQKIKLITKCGIILPSDKFPQHKTHHYDYSFDHIIKSVENSLENLQTDFIDLLLLHRPAPFFNPKEVARAFRKLFEDGKVLHFGVSNFNPAQYEMLNKHCDQNLVTNQIEISPYCLEHFLNGSIDFCLKEDITPMAWSPLAAGRFTHSQNEREMKIQSVLTEVATELGVEEIEKIMYAWLLSHPAGIIPVVGSGKLERIRLAAESLAIRLNLDQWYKIYVAANGKPLP